VYENWEMAWLACAMDSEGSLCVSLKVKDGAKLYLRPIIEINNTSRAYIQRCCDLLDNLGIDSYSVYERFPSFSATKSVHILNIRGQKSVVTLLSAVSPYLIIKQDFAYAIIGLFGDHKLNSGWSEKEIAAAIAVRTVYMPRSIHGNGEVETTREDALKLVAEFKALGFTRASVIPSEALGSVCSTREPLESRAMSNADNKSLHECPATAMTVEDVLRSSRKLESWDKEPSEDIETV
jgi:hypothetical protein